jgi:hypothetical protein
LTSPIPKAEGRDEAQDQQQREQGKASEQPLRMDLLRGNAWPPEEYTYA